MKHAVSRQPSAVNRQPSAVSRQPSAVNRQPSAVNRQPSAVSRQPQQDLDGNPLSAYLRTLWQRFFGLNSSLVTPLLFVGGQFRPAQWPQLQRLGVRAVLSLQAEYEDRFSGPPPEMALRLLVPDFTPPSLAQLAAGVAFVTEAHRAKLPVFIHCHAGVGRAPIMAAAYLVTSRALSAQEALACVRAARPIIRPNAAQVARLREYAA